MNSFALLQDDVEDASDLAPSTAKAASSAPDESPADAVQDARAARDERKPDPVRTEPKHVSAEASEGVEEDKEKSEAGPPPPPKEKDLSFDEYQAQKAQLSSGLASLNSKGVRKANDGKSSGFENMSVLRKDSAAAPDDSLMGSVPVKEMHEIKGLKDSTQAAVLKNAEIQSFFKRDPSAPDRRPNNGPRRGGDARRGGESRRGGFDVRRGGSRGRGFERDREGGRMDFRRDRDQGGGYGRGRGSYSNRGGYGRGSQDNQQGPNDGPNGRQQGSRSFGNGPPKVPIAPNVDDTAAFPSL